MGNEHHFCPGSHPLFQFLQPELIVVRLVKRHRHRHRSQKLRVQKIRGVAGVRNQHLVPLPQEGHHGIQKTAVRAGGDDHVPVGVDGKSRPPGDVLSQHSPKLRHSNGQGVMGRGARGQSRLHGRLHRLRHGRIRVKGVGPGHDLAAGGLEFGHPVAHVRLLGLGEDAAL